MDITYVGKPGSKAKKQLVDVLPYLEIQEFWVDTGKGGLDPCICFSHRPDPEGTAHQMRIYMEADKATELADAVLALLNEIHRRRDPEAAEGDTGLLASALFGGGDGENDNPMFDGNGGVDDDV